MLRTISSACAALMVLTAPMTTPAFAFPAKAPVTAPSAIISVQADGSSPNITPQPNANRRWDRGNNWERDRDRWEPRQSRRERERWAQRRGNDVYWRGHRGYRDYRPGYRRHGDFWFPPAAFIAGAIIGGAMASQAAPRQVYRGNDPHVEWCYARYKSYRASDNTFQPYNGPRRYCNSPYG